MKKIISKACAALMAVMMLVGCGEEPDTPERALSEIKQSIEQYDYEKFSARVDVERMLAAAYEDSAAELTLRAEQFNALYPDDPFFRNDPEFIATYIELNRAEHMKFVAAVLEKCFDRDLQVPTVLADDTIAGTASELRNYYTTASSMVKSTTADGARAVMRLDVEFESLYASRRVTLPLVLEFEKRDERWRLVRINEVDAMLDPLVEIAEVLWPDQFNF